MPRGRKNNRATEPPGTANFKPIEVPDDEGEDIISSSEEESSDDPVVNTYQVFVSDQLKDHLYLLQYPIRNPDEPYYNQYSPYSARIKPKEGSLEIDVPLDPNNFSLHRGEKFAGHSQTEHGIKQEFKILDRQRLSGKTHDNEASYFVGIMGADQLHLSPVKATIQLRPNFHYYDLVFGGEKRKKPATEEAASRQPRAIQQQIKSSDDPRGSGQHQQSYEEFVPLEWVDTMHPETLEISDRLISRDVSKEFVSSVPADTFLGGLFFKDGVSDTTRIKTEG